MTEGELLRWLRRRDPRLERRLRNDAAVLPLDRIDPADIATGGMAVTVDHQIEGVHFLPGLDPDRVARRLLAVNLSDLAAMGATPRYALLALAAPAAFDHQAFFRGLLAACRHFDIELVGGDLARADRLHTSLTAFGSPPAGGRFLPRSSARPGDHLWLGGAVGLAAAGLSLLRLGARWEDGTLHLPEACPQRGALATIARRAILRHLEPRPQLALGHWLGRQSRAAALDISDGLALDLARLCDESGVGAQVDGDNLPGGDALAALCQAMGWETTHLQLEGGEDYALLFALPPAIQPPEAFQCHRLGTLTADPRRTWTVQGRSQPLRRSGWDHLS